ncbi:MAG: hypothetical protein ABJB74_18885, partial [Gemmatimonas sp.]
MFRLPMLAVAALLLPNVGAKLTAGAESPATVAHVTAAGFPGFGLPKFLRFKRKPGVEVELNVMKARLRELVVQEEAFYAQNKSYTKNVNKLAPTVTLKDSVSNGVQIEILFAGSKGWSAVASHSNAPGRSCVAYVGQAESIPVMPRTRLEGNSATM